MKRHIFLTGLPGSGKSTVGLLLARLLNYPLLDIDALIEQECGERIPAIFARHGEEYFRACESRVLEQSASRNECSIIVTGGGIVTRSLNRTIMAERGMQIFLRVDPVQALQRLQAQQQSALDAGQVPETRPLLEGPEPLARLQHLYAERLPWYEEAELFCETPGKNADQVAREIVSMLISSGIIEGGDPIVRHVSVGSGYDAIVDWGGMGRLASYLSQLSLPPRLFIITDSNLNQLYSASLLPQLEQAGFEPSVYTIPAGEGSKSSEQLNAIYDWLVEQHAERREAIVAFGGGVVGDLAGFVAATYLRGVPLVHVPTSLLAQVDSAIGGKTGINHPKGKNLIGAFYHPRLVLADPALLLTLPLRERTEGWAEIVKYGIILDAELFALLEANAHVLHEFAHPPVSLLSQIIARCIDLKAVVIEGDEREQGQRAILNYGHTVGHALENASGYGEWLHGEAVSLGMVAAAQLAQEHGLFSPEEAERQNRLLAALGLPTVYQGSVSASDILSTMQLDKKVVGKRVRWVMPRHIGEVIVTPLPDELVGRVVSSFFEKRGP